MKEDRYEIGIVGSRRRTQLKDYIIIRDIILKLKPTELLSGGCRSGADSFAEQLAKELNIPIKIFRPVIEDGMKYFQMCNAYFHRNEKIAKYCDVLLALPSPERKGGTENTIKYAKKYNKEVILK